MPASVSAIPTYRSVDNLPDKVPTDRLEQFRIRTGRGQNDNVEVSDTAMYQLSRSFQDEQIYRTIKTDRFTVEFAAQDTLSLHLDWLYTKARLTNTENGPILQIIESGRYGQKDIEQHGHEQVIQWVNEDRRELAEIMEAYCSYRSSPVIFNPVVSIFHHQIGLVGQAQMHECIYDSYEEFFNDRSGYVYDLFRKALSNARSHIAEIRQDLCV